MANPPYLYDAQELATWYRPNVNEVREEDRDSYRRAEAALLGVVTGQLSLNVAEYSRRLFGMYAGKTMDLSIRFDNSLVNAVIDRFGEEVDLDPGEDSFVAHVQVEVSPAFYSWLMMFGEQAEILEPDRAREELRRRAQAIAALYQDQEEPEPGED